MKTILTYGVVGVFAHQVIGCPTNTQCVVVPTTRRIVIRPSIEVAPPNHHGWKDWRYQVVISGMAAGDSVAAFTSATNGVNSTQTGRLNPLALPSMLVGSPSGPLTVFTEGGGTQRRIAGANCVTMSTNLDWGVRTGQPPRNLAGGEFDGSLNPAFMQFDLVLGSTPGPRDITITVPIASVLGGGATYYLNDDGSSVGFMPLTQMDLPTIHIHVLACRSDFNSDDAIDFFDYLDFVDAFTSGNPDSDFDGDGHVDFFDYLSFINQFAEGC